MNTNSRCQFYFQPSRNLSGKCRSVSVRLQNRDLKFIRQPQKLFRHRQITAKNNARNFVRENSLHLLKAFLNSLLFHVRMFYLTDNLDSVMIEIVKESRKLQRRTVNI